MSIATEQKVEHLLKRLDELEMDVAELRQIVEAKIASTPKDHQNGARPNKR